MERPYRYKLTYKWSGDCVSEDHRGYRTRADGTRENFHNDEFDGKDPLPVIRAEQAGCRIFGNDFRSRPVKELVIIVAGDQAKE